MSLGLNGKRILLIYDVAYPYTQGGGQKRMWEIAKRLRAHGAYVDWVSFKTWPGNSEVVQQEGINYIGLQGFRGLYAKNGKRRIFEPIEFLWALLRKKIAIDEYDIIWLGQWPILHIFLVILRRKSILAKVYIDWWEIWGLTWFRYSLIAGWAGYLFEKCLLRFITARSNLIIISDKAFECIGRYGEGERQISLIRNGINLQLLEKYCQSNKEFDLVYFGRLKEHKRIDILIEAIHYIKEVYDAEVTLQIIGGGPELSRLKEFARRLSVEHLIYFKGILDDDVLYEQVAKSRIHVNPSTKEGGGSITTLEAFGMGLPVLGFDCIDGIDASLLCEDNGGVLVERISHVNLGDEILKLINDEQQLAKLSKNANSFAQICDWDSIAAQYEKLFLKAVDRGFKTI
jgi:glycosyltransferase involved in cell wall biosynthesis